ncbi:SRPBCC family protein [Subtercola boreus]|nr:SRPBCC family protein [Subtercola boreus]TQL55687.1 polyketide cyclase/dehydrase/lipid transport protein [Subtercola boreus]
MSQIVHSIDLPVDVATVFEFWMDIESFPAIMETVTRVTVTGLRHSYWEIRLGGIDWEYDAIVTSVVRGDHIDWKSTTGELELLGRASFEALNAGGCRLTVEIVWTPRSFVERVGALFGDDSRAVTRELDNFREYVTRKTGVRHRVAD